MSTLRLVISGVIVLSASHALANRCEWNRLQNRANCCTASEQAIWDPLRNEVVCTPSLSGDSCTWSQLSNSIACCPTDQHAVWSPLSNSLQCFTIPGSESGDFAG